MTQLLSGCRPKTYSLLICTSSFMPLFSLTLQAQRKKLGKKETPQRKEFRALQEKEFASEFESTNALSEEGVAPPPHKLLKKFDQNFHQTDENR